MADPALSQVTFEASDDGWSPCKVCDALDFFRPEIVENIRRVGEEPRFHAKQWEYAQLLEAKRRLAPNAKTLVGVGCGCEPTIPLLAEGADEIICTDLYGMPGAWDVASRRPDEVFPQLRNLCVHSMDMRRVDLRAESADFVWSLCAIEHVGDGDAIVDAARQAGRLLKPGGVMFLTSEFTFGDQSVFSPGRSSTLFLDRVMVRRLFTESGLHLVAPMDLRLSAHPFNAPLWWLINNDYPMLPHCGYSRKRLGVVGYHSTCFSMALCREDRGMDRMIEDPAGEPHLDTLRATARRLSRHVTAPHKWWW